MVIAAVVALVCGASAWVLVTALERARHRARQQSILAALGEPHHQRGATGLVATLEGHLGDGAPTITSFHPRGTAFLEEANAYALTHRPADGPLVVDLGDGHRAAIEGDVQVLAGSLESEHDAPLAAAASFEARVLAERDTARNKTGQFRQVKAGDLVRIRGTIEPAPDDDALYREGSQVVRVRPAPGAVVNVVEIASPGPTTRRRIRPARAAWLASTATFLVGATAALFALPAPSEDRTVAPVKGPAKNTCRAAVLERIARDDPAGTAAAFEGCDDAYARGMEAFARAAFGEASLAFAKALESDADLPPSLTETQAHLFAHEHARAARASRRMVERFYPGPSTVEKRYLECISGLLDELAKDGPASQRRGLAGDAHRKTVHPKACLEGPFAKFAHGVDDGTFNVLMDDDSAAYTAVGNPFTALVATRARLRARPFGVERDLLDRFVLAPGPPPGHPSFPDGEGHGAIDFSWWVDAGDLYLRMTALAAELSLFYAHAGLPERAAALWPHLDRVAATREAKRHFHAPLNGVWNTWNRESVDKEDGLVRYVMSIAAAAAFLAGDEARATRYLSFAEVHSASVQKQLARTLRGAPWEEPKEDGRWGDRRALFAAAATGDGAAVARVLAEQGATGAEVLPRIFPRLDRNRAALDEWFAKSFPPSCLTCGASSYFGHLVDRRTVARQLGKTAEADRLTPIITRFVDAQTDVTIAWELDELETFFARPR